MSAIVTDLIAWGRAAGRRPPWRVAGSPYALGTAEILLQKTKVEDAAPVWAAVMKAYPTAAAMANAAYSELYALVTGLGLGNQRTVRLKAMALAVCDGWPEDKVPGIGPYGSAIVALEQGRMPRVPPADGNIARVVCRLHELSFERGEPRKKPEVKQAVGELLMAAGDARSQLQALYALVDLGATVCTPNRPKCPVCPLLDVCAAASKAGLGSCNALEIDSASA